LKTRWPTPFLVRFRRASTAFDVLKAAFMG